MFERIIRFVRRTNINRSLSSIEEHVEKILKSCDVFHDNYHLMDINVLRQISDIEVSMVNCLDSVRTVSYIIRKEK